MLPYRSACLVLAQPRDPLVAWSLLHQPQISTLLFPVLLSMTSTPLGKTLCPSFSVCRYFFNCSPQPIHLHSAAPPANYISHQSLSAAHRVTSTTWRRGEGRGVGMHTHTLQHYRSALLTVEEGGKQAENHIASNVPG